MQGSVPVPRVLFATGGLRRDSGGIAGLSRQVVRSLLEMHCNSSINLNIHSLENLTANDRSTLFPDGNEHLLRDFGGDRRWFALATAVARADLRLFDHVGLARLEGLNPLRRGRYVLLIHGVEMWRSERPDYHRTARRAGLLIANSEYTARRARETWPDLPPIRVCLPGTDGVGLRAAGQGAGLPEPGPHAMLIVGRLDPAQRHKGHDQLLDALPLILQRVPDARLIIAGSGADRGRLEERVRDLGLVRHVVFTGHADEAQLHALYRRCALFVMPSEGDGFGLVFLEAMMHGLPCAGLASGAAAEILEDGVSGVLLDRENVREMADRLGSLLLDDVRRAALGRSGAGRHEAMFTGRHYAHRLQSILEDHLAVSGQPAGGSRRAD